MPITIVTRFLRLCMCRTLLTRLTSILSSETSNPVDSNLEMLFCQVTLYNQINKKLGFIFPLVFTCFLVFGALDEPLLKLMFDYILIWPTYGVNLIESNFSTRHFLLTVKTLTKILTTTAKTYTM